MFVNVNIGDPCLLLFGGGAAFTEPFPIFKISFLQFRWIGIFSNVRGGEAPGFTEPFPIFKNFSDNI